MMRIQYLLGSCCLLLLLGGCTAEAYTPIEPEEIQMQVNSTKISDTEDNSVQKHDVNTNASNINVTQAPTPTLSHPLPQPGVHSIENLLRTALLPVGNTMYVWGGGWNETDTGAGIEALTLGLSTQWSIFAAEQDKNYNYKDTKYQIHDGLDCSGYIGWLIYNVIKTENTTSEEDGYVMSSTKMAETFSGYGWGEYLTENITEWKPGDICSMSGHVWMSLGMCSDGSVLLLHSSPPGVRICGTRLADGSTSQAITLAEQIMSTHYTDWYSRYPACDVNYNYLSTSKVLRWNSDTLEDHDGIQNMTADEVLQLLGLCTPH